MLKYEALYDWLFEGGYTPELVEDDSEITICCTLCSDDRPRLYISCDSGAWTDFHCGESGGLHRLLTAVCGLDVTDAIDLARSWRDADAIETDYLAPREEKAQPAAVDVVLPAQMLPIDRRTPEQFAKYLERRHVSLELAAARGVGYCEAGRYARRIIVPVETDGHLYTFVARTILSQCPNCAERLDKCVCSRPFPKVLTPKGGHPRLTVYNFDAVRRGGSPSLVVVEGVFDALRLPNEAVALLGSTASHTQIALLAGLARGRRCILALDGDMAGYRGALKLADALTAELVQVSVALLPSGSDPGSLRAEEFETCLTNAQPYIL